MKKIIILAALLATFSASSLAAKTFDFEALYGYGWVNQKPTKGTEQHAQARAIFYTDNYTHEALFAYNFAANLKANGISYNGDQSLEAEYRFGSRMDGDATMAKMGMLSGSAYAGLGYRSINVKATALSKKATFHYIYLPFGFWGEDDSGISNLKIRYGLNLRTKLFANDDIAGMAADGSINQKWRFKMLFGGKVYGGVAYSIGGALDIFAQLFYSYNIPTRSTHNYGFEAGIKF